MEQHIFIVHSQNRRTSKRMFVSVLSINEHNCQIFFRRIPYILFCSYCTSPETVTKLGTSICFWYVLRFVGLRTRIFVNHNLSYIRNVKRFQVNSILNDFKQVMKGFPRDMKNGVLVTKNLGSEHLYLLVLLFFRVTANITTE